MEHLQTANLNLEKDGWELLLNEKEVLQANVGDIVKIIVVHVSPLDYENDRPIRSVSHEPLWVHIDSQEADGYIGSLKSKPSHEMEIKDGTKFEIGDTISFKSRNILAIRG